MSTPDFFRSRLDQMIDLMHPLAVLSKRLPWASLEAAVAPKLARDARPAKQLSGEGLAGSFEVSSEAASARRAAHACLCA